METGDWEDDGEEKRKKKQRLLGRHNQEICSIIKYICGGFLIIISLINTFSTLPQKRLSRAVREGLTEEAVLKMSRKRCAGVGQVDGAEEKEVCLLQTKTSPSNFLKPTADSASVSRPCPGF